MSVTTENTAWLDAPLTDGEIESLELAAKKWVPGGFRKNPAIAYEAISLFQLLLRDYKALKARA